MSSLTQLGGGSLFFFFFFSFFFFFKKEHSSKMDYFGTTDYFDRYTALSQLKAGLKAQTRNSGIKVSLREEICFGRTTSILHLYQTPYMAFKGMFDALRGCIPNQDNKIFKRKCEKLVCCCVLTPRLSAYKTTRIVQEHFTVPRLAWLSLSLQQQLWPEPVR